jgi:hypothetical protein
MGLAGIPWFLAKFTTGLYSGTMIEKFLPNYFYPGGGHLNSETMWLIYGFIALISPVGLILGRSWVQKGEARRALAS